MEYAPVLRESPRAGVVAIPPDLSIGAVPLADEAGPRSVMAICAAPHAFLLENSQTGPAARFRLHDENFLVLSDPMVVHAVLNGNADDFEKGTVSEIPRAFWRDGIITVEGDGWTEQHRHATLQPANAVPIRSGPARPAGTVGVAERLTSVAGAAA